MRKTVLSLVILAGASFALSACNTAAGFGQDMSAAGHALTGSADRIKNGEPAQSGSSVAPAYSH
jgi:entericidin B